MLFSAVFYILDGIYQFLSQGEGVRGTLATRHCPVCDADVEGNVRLVSADKFFTMEKFILELTMFFHLLAVLPSVCLWAAQRCWWRPVGRYGKCVRSWSFFLLFDKLLLTVEVVLYFGDIIMISVDRSRGLASQSADIAYHDFMRGQFLLQTAYSVALLLTVRSSSNKLLALN